MATLFEVSKFSPESLQASARLLQSSYKVGAFHVGLLTHPVGAIPPWLPRTLGDRSKVKYSL
jgi:hypothetical protein